MISLHLKKLKQFRIYDSSVFVLMVQSIIFDWEETKLSRKRGGSKDEENARKTTKQNEHRRKSKNAYIETIWTPIVIDKLRYS